MRVFRLMIIPYVLRFYSCMPGPFHEFVTRSVQSLGGVTCKTTREMRCDRYHHGLR